MTARRRLDRLVRRGLAFCDPRGFFVATEAGRQALGDTPPSKPIEPWVKTSAISAAAARDVRDRQTHHTFDDRSRRAQRARHEARRLAEAAHRVRKRQFSESEFDLTG